MSMTVNEVFRYMHSTVNTSLEMVTEANGSVESWQKLAADLREKCKNEDNRQLMIDACVFILKAVEDLYNERNKDTAG